MNGVKKNVKEAKKSITQKRFHNLLTGQTFKASKKGEIEETKSVQMNEHSVGDDKEKESASFFKGWFSRKRTRAHSLSEQMTSSCKSSLRTSLVIGEPKLISTSCSQISQSFDLFDTKSDEFDGSIDEKHVTTERENGMVDEIPFIETDHVDEPYKAEQNVTSQMVKNKYFTDEGELCFSTNVVNCPPRNCHSYQFPSYPPRRRNSDGDSLKK